MRAKNFEVVLRVGERLQSAQAREREAAEAYRRAPGVETRAAALDALHVVELLTSAYLDASMEFVEDCLLSDTTAPEYLNDEMTA